MPQQTQSHLRILKGGNGIQQGISLLHTSERMSLKVSPRANSRTQEVEV